MFLLYLLIFIVLLSCIFLIKTGGKSGDFKKIKVQCFDLIGDFESKENKITLIKKALEKENFTKTIKFIEDFIEMKTVDYIEKIKDKDDYLIKYLNIFIKYHNINVTVRSDFYTKMIPSKKVPDSFIVYNSNIDVDRIKNCFKQLYKNNKDNIIILGKQQQVLSMNLIYNRSTYSTFNCSLEFLKQKAKDQYIYNVFKKLFSFLQKKSGNNFSLMEINHYPGNLGLRQHLDAVTAGRTENIYTVNIGEEFCYDVFPILDDFDNPVRFFIPKGGIFLMQENLRYKWTHGLPDNNPNTVGKFSIVFKMGKVENLEYVKDLHEIAKPSNSDYN